MSDRPTAPGTPMRAATLHARGDLRVGTRTVPRPGPGEVLLRTGTVGLCGTDAAEYGKGPSMVPVEVRHPVTGHLGPMVLGHEFSGQVVEVGAGVEPGWLDRQVACCGAVSCGRCWQCARGRTNLCVSYSAVGLHRDGALAEFVTTPITSCAAVDELGLTPDAAALGQPMSIAVHARERGRLAPSERAVVVGVGGIGAFLVYAAVAAGASVVAVDPSPARRVLAEQLGAARGVPADPTEADVLDCLGGPPHVVYEASGAPAGLALALALLPPGGRLVLVGLQKTPGEIDLRRAALTELELIGTNAMVRSPDFDTALALVASRPGGWADVAPTVAPLDDVALLLDQIGRGASPAVKVLVDPRLNARRDSDTASRPPCHDTPGAPLMPHAVVRAADAAFAPEGEGFSAAVLVGAQTGSIHLEVSHCRLEPGAVTPASLHPFEESWYVLEGSGEVSVADLTYQVGLGAYGVLPPAVARQLRAGPDGMRWLRTRAPQPRLPEHRAGVPATDWVPATPAREPSETDPRSRWAGQFQEQDMGPYGPLSMPGYHGPNIRSIFVRMLVDDLLGAHHHTLFMVEFGPQATKGNAATEHYHPFEEAYFLTSGSATGTLDGEVVDVAAGDLVWTGVNGTHGFVNDGDEPVRWLEVQAPTPPASDAFFFPKDWDGLA